MARACGQVSLELAGYMVLRKTQQKEAGDEAVHLIEMYSRKETETNVIVFA